MHLLISKTRIYWKMWILQTQKCKWQPPCIQHEHKQKIDVHNICIQSISNRVEDPEEICSAPNYVHPSTTVHLRIGTFWNFGILVFCYLYTSTRKMCGFRLFRSFYIRTISNVWTTNQFCKSLLEFFRSEKWQKHIGKKDPWTIYL